MTGQGLIGIVVIIVGCVLASEDRRAIRWRPVLLAIVLQGVVAAILLHLGAARAVFMIVNDMVMAVQSATAAGTTFAFGYLGGGVPPFEVVRPASTFILALQALPIVLVLSALSRLLFHWRILPLLVGAVAWALRRTLGLGGAAGIAVAANIFVGMVEAPLLVRPYLSRLSRGELFLVMTAGMATIAGTVFILYATILSPVVADAAGHLLGASMINVIGAALVSALLVPPTAVLVEGGFEADGDDANAMAALTRGALDGMALLLNVVAMLVVLVALVALIDAVLALLPTIGGAPVTLRRVFSLPMAPAAWLIGIPWAEAPTAGSLLATKVTLNELIAFSDLTALPPDALSARSRLILVYALAGFANAGSLGIMIGGLSAMMPERRSEIAGLGIKAVIAGLLATGLSGAWVGLLA